MTCMRAWRDSKFGAVRPPTAELAAFQRQKNPHRLIIGKTVLPPFLSCFDRILFILASIDDIHKSLDMFEIQPVPTTDHRVLALERLKIDVATFSRLFFIGSF